MGLRNCQTRPVRCMQRLAVLLNNSAVLLPPTTKFQTLVPFKVQSGISTATTSTENRYTALYLPDAAQLGPVRAEFG